MPDLSVIICTHNPRADCLRRTLESLAAQTLPKEQWELLIVDNASQPPLVAEHCDIVWHPRGRLVHEDRMGIIFARLCGVQESAGQLLVFVDDDNVLAPDYLENVIAIAARYPHLAVFGAGTLEPEFEIQPPAELNSLLFMLALRSVPVARWSNHPQDSSCRPFGAGICVHRKAAGQFAAFVEKIKAGTLLGRKGGKLFQHEDDLISWAAAEAGQGFGIFPELRITHLISSGRLNRAYFLRLIYYSTFSHWILHYMLVGDQPQGISFFRAVHTGLHALRNGFFSARCQWAQAKGEDWAARFILENQLTPVAGAATKSKK